MKKLIEYKDIEKAKNILGIGDTASIKTIREHYKELAKSNHPDKHERNNKEKYEEKIKKINNAYKILMDYCENYSIPFDIKDFAKTKHDSKFDEFMRDWF